MKIAPLPINEELRLKSLKDLNILDSLPTQDLDELTFLAAQVCDTPIALISLVDKNRQWFKSKIGLEACETSRDIAFCAHAILGNDVLIIEDALKDERFFDNPLVTGGPLIRFYAGAPLYSPSGLPIGSVCVIDTKPKTLTEGMLSALKALSNQVTRRLEFSHYISELKISKEKNVFKKTALESIYEGVILQDKSGKIIDCNPAASMILGISEGDLLDKYTMDPKGVAIKSNGESFKFDEQPALVSIKTGDAQKDVVMGVRLDENLRWLSVNSVPIFLDESRRPTHVVTSFADITLHVDNEHNLKKIFDGVPSMIGHWGKDLKNYNANQAYSDYLGKTPAELKGKNFKDLVGDERFAKNLPYINEVLKGKTINFERDIIDKGGITRQTLASYIPNMVDGKVESFLAVITDISDVKKIETKMIESSRLSVLGEMAVGMAHEINNPLAIINGKMKMLKRKLEAGSYDIESNLKDFQLIEDTVKRIATVIKGLRSYSRNAGSDPFYRVRVKEIIHNTISLCQERFKDSNINLTVNCDDSCFFECRTTQISQVLMNLLLNSLEAIGENKDKWVTIEVKEKNEKIIIEYTDSGSGIPQAIADKMMNPFFTTKDVGKGTGLGLSISQGLAEAHLGSLTYDSTATNTKFILTIPVVHPINT